MSSLRLAAGSAKGRVNRLSSFLRSSWGSSRELRVETVAWQVKGRGERGVKRGAREQQRSQGGTGEGGRSEGGKGASGWRGWPVQVGGRAGRGWGRGGVRAPGGQGSSREPRVAPSGGGATVVALLRVKYGTLEALPQWCIGCTVLIMHPSGICCSANFLMAHYSDCMM